MCLLKNSLITHKCLLQSCLLQLSLTNKREIYHDYKSCSLDIFTDSYEILGENICNELIFLHQEFHSVVEKTNSFIRDKNNAISGQIFHLENIFLKMEELLSPTLEKCKHECILNFECQ